MDARIDPAAAYGISRGDAHGKLISILNYHLFAGELRAWELYGNRHVSWEPGSSAPDLSLAI